MSANIRYIVQKTADELALLTVFAKVSFENSQYFSDEEFAVLAALRRTTPDLTYASPEEIGDYLRTMDADSMVGVVNNTKGVLHEMEFVAVENDDGDTVYASLFDDPHHPDFDVQLSDSDSGEVWNAQLKTTDSSDYVNDWLDEHPDGDILVNTEMAEKLGIASSGFSNEELTLRTEDFLDKALAADDSSIWDYVPLLSVASISWVVWGLWQRYQQHEITLMQFKQYAAQATGLKVAKITTLVLLLSIPVVNVLTGAALVTHILCQVRDMASATNKPRVCVQT